MNTNTLKAALTQHTAKQFLVISEKEYAVAFKRSPAVSQDVMYIGTTPYVVTRCYGAGVEAYAVEDASSAVLFFKQV